VLDAAADDLPARQRWATAPGDRRFAGGLQVALQQQRAELGSEGASRARLRECLRVAVVDVQRAPHHPADIGDHGGARGDVAGAVQPAHLQSIDVRGLVQQQLFGHVDAQEARRHPGEAMHFDPWRQPGDLGLAHVLAVHLGLASRQRQVGRKTRSERCAAVHHGGAVHAVQQYDLAEIEQIQHPRAITPPGNPYMAVDSLD